MMQPLDTERERLGMKNYSSESHQIERFTALMRALQRIDAEFPLQYCVCLAEIAMNEGLSLTQLAEKTDLSLSTVSRIVGALSDYRKNNQPYGLVKLIVSKTERRRKEIYLTPKGTRVIEMISECMKDNQTASKASSLKSA
jgi:DNA-binding MarR family transcriptional regulator